MFGRTIVLRKKKKSKRKKVFYFLPIVFIMIFSVTTLFFADKDIKNNATEEVKTNSVEVFKEVNDYSLYYMPVVINNFYDYKKGDFIDNETLIKMGIISIVCTQEVTKYEVFDGKTVLSAEVLKERIEKLFSKDIKFENSGIKIENYIIEYNKASDLYTIPHLAFLPEYSPLLESVSVKNGKTILTIGCIKSDNFKQDSSGNMVVPEAEKKVILTLEKDKKGFYISEISEE